MHSKGFLGQESKITDNVEALAQYLDAFHAIRARTLKIRENGIESTVLRVDDLLNAGKAEEELRQYLENVERFSSDAFKRMGGDVQNFTEVASGGFSAFSQGAQDHIVSVQESVVGANETMIDSVAGMVESQIASTQTFTDAVTEGGIQMTQAMANASTQMATDFTGAADTVRTESESAAEILDNSISTAASSAASSVQSFVSTTNAGLRSTEGQAYKTAAAIASIGSASDGRGSFSGSSSSGGAAPGVTTSRRTLDTRPELIGIKRAIVEGNEINAAGNAVLDSRIARLEKAVAHGK